eukprot:SAG31_NODE_43475_length_267_cov_0.607143_1_plen_27_part_01
MLISLSSGHEILITIYTTAKVVDELYC